MGDLDRWIENIKQCELLPELDLRNKKHYERFASTITSSDGRAAPRGAR